MLVALALANVLVALALAKLLVAVAEEKWVDQKSRQPRYNNQMVQILLWNMMIMWMCITIEY